jgi:hypothetical protein
MQWQETVLTLPSRLLNNVQDGVPSQIRAPQDCATMELPGTVRALPRELLCSICWSVLIDLSDHLTAIQSLFGCLFDVVLPDSARI